MKTIQIVMKITMRPVIVASSLLYLLDLSLVHSSFLCYAWVVPFKLLVLNYKSIGIGD